jgi:transglutaminase-like putative cysteine protease
VSVVSFKYQTDIAFSSPASGHQFVLKVLPQNDGRQRITALSWHTWPPGPLWRTRDGFGNEALSGYIEAPHEYFRFGIGGAAEIEDTPFTAGGGYERVLLYPTPLTRPHGGLEAFYKKLAADAPDEKIRRVLYFSAALHARLRYERGATTARTPAREAFDAGAGVCQDYAHIMLALLRLDGLPCRYVAGLASDCGETHAWVEVWLRDGYYGLDPTRDKPVDGGYVALSRGRDFEDCSVERGVFKGLCKGTQTISLTMEKL